jgi:succinyl-CoA synthetase alpha subunit
MSVLINRHTRVITHGVNDKLGHFHTGASRRYGAGRKCFVGAVEPAQAGQVVEGMPMFGSVQEAVDATGATASVIYLPPPLAAAAIEQAIDAELELVVCITEGIPPEDMLRVRRRLQESRTLLLGPGSAGIITPDEIKIGTMPGQIHQKGCIGVLSRSEALSHEALGQLAACELGQSTEVGIGSDELGGLRAIDVLRLFEADPETKAVLMVGEVAGEAQEACVRWVRDHMKKPVVAFMTGCDTPDTDFALLEKCGIRATCNPAELGDLLSSVIDPQWLPFD